MFQWFYYWKVSLGSYVLKGMSNKITASLHDVEFFQLSQVPYYSGYSITLTIQMSTPPHFATFYTESPCPAKPPIRSVDLKTEQRHFLESPHSKFSVCWLWSSTVSNKFQCHAHTELSLVWNTKQSYSFAQKGF